MRKRKDKPMRADYSDVDLGVGVRGKYLKGYYASGDGEPKGRKAEASLPRVRKRR
jgi:hypothetical protein